MILIAEPVHFGDVHVQVNSAFIAMFRQIYGKEAIEVYAEANHIAALKANMGQDFDAVKFKTFRQYSNPGLFYWFQKIIGEWYHIFKVVATARKSKPELLVWLCLFPTGQFLVQVLSKLFLRQQQQVIILHGEMEYLNKRTQKFVDQVLGYTLRKALNMAPGSTRYIVLGHSIKKNVDQLGLKCRNRIFAMQHPYVYDQQLTNKHQPKKALRVCTFGVLKKAKNAHLFFQLAERFKTEIEAGIISFHTVGKIYPDVWPYINPLVDCYKPDQFLPQQEYEQAIAANDIAVFCYDESMYQLSASGVLHESLRLSLPVYALNNAYFAHFVDTYKIGKVFINLNEMYVAFCQLLQHKEQIGEQSVIDNLRVFFEKNSVLLQSEKLRDLLRSSIL